MGRPALPGLWVAVALVVSSIGSSAFMACKHDLDALKKDHPSLREAGAGDSGKGGRGGSDSGSGGKGGTSGSTAGSSGSGPVDAGLECGPCDKLSDPAEALGLRSCCRGVLGDECGLTFGEGTLCLPRAVPAQESATCGELRVAGTSLPGCCRPDGRCGVLAEGVGLGCVAREELVPALGAGADAPEAIACEYSCEADDDCRGVLKGLICAETREHDRRYCAETCQRDLECRKGLGQLCGLTNDKGMNRVIATCRPPIGELAPPDLCTRAEDCTHGVCSIPELGDPYCSQLCRSASDCPPGYKACVSVPIPRPDAGMPQSFSICLR